MDNPLPTKKTKKTKSFSCPLCKINCYSSRSLTNHIPKCRTSSQPSRSIHLPEYNNATFNREIRAGTINPHIFPSGTQYRHQLHYYPSVVSQANAATTSNIHNSTDNGSSTPPQSNTILTMDMTAEDFNDDSCNFSPSDGSVDEEDCHLDRDDYIPEPSLPMLYNDATMRYAQLKTKRPNETTAPPKFQYENTMPAVVTALGQLLLMIKGHGGTKSLYNDIVEFIFEWSTLHPGIFVKKHGVPKWDRKRVIEHIGEVFQTTDLIPVNHEIKLSDNRVVTIPVTNWEALARDILDDPEVIELISENLDPDTWRPKVKPMIHENDDNAIIGEKDSGYLYAMGIDLHCPSDKPKDVLPLPVILHMDATHCGRSGANQLTPTQFSFGMFSMEGQLNSKTWRSCAFIPNLGIGKGKNGKKKDDPINKQKDLHACMNVALSSFRECCERGGFMWQHPNGNDTLVKPYLFLHFGDNKALHEACNHYGSVKARCLVKDCKCCKDDYTTFPSKCRFPDWAELIQCKTANQAFDLFEKCNLVTYRDISRAKEDPDFAKHISKHATVDNAFETLPLADRFLGIIGITPQEFLHNMGRGMYIHWITSIREVVGENTKNSRVKGDIDELFADIRFALNHNSEQDICRMSNRNGFFNVTNLTAEETRGNFFGLVVLMHTQYGQELMRPCFEKNGISYNEMLRTCLLIMAWERFYLQPQKRKDVKASYYATQRLQKRIIKHIPREKRAKTEKRAGIEGYGICKFHGMTYAAAIMLKVGCLLCVDAGKNEFLHKLFIKSHYNQTQRIADRFASQTAQGEYERVLLEKMDRHMMKYLPEEVRHITAKRRQHQMERKYDNQFYHDSDSENSEDDDSSSLDGESVSQSSECVGVDVGDGSNVGNLHPVRDYTVRGRFFYNIALDSRQTRTTTHKWAWKARNNIHHCNPHSLVGKVLSDFHLKYCLQYNVQHRSQLRYECFTHDL